MKYLTLLVFLIGLCTLAFFFSSKKDDVQQQAVPVITKEEIEPKKEAKAPLAAKSKKEKDTPPSFTPKVEVKKKQEVVKAVIVNPKEIKLELLSENLTALERHELEQSLSTSEQEGVNELTQEMITTGFVDLGVKPPNRAPGAISRLISGIRVAANRNLTSSVPSIISAAKHQVAGDLVRVEAIKALGRLNTKESKSFLKNFSSDEPYIDGQVLLSRAMLGDDGVFVDSLEHLKSDDDEMQELALNSIMLVANSENQNMFYEQIDGIRKINHMSLAMTLKTIGTPEAITNLEKLNREFGSPFSEALNN